MLNRGKKTMRKNHRHNAKEDLIKRVCSCIQSSLMIFERPTTAGWQFICQTSCKKEAQCGDLQLCRAMRGAACHVLNREREDTIRKEAEACRETK